MKKKTRRINNLPIEAQILELQWYTQGKVSYNPRDVISTAIGKGHQTMLGLNNIKINNDMTISFFVKEYFVKWLTGVI